MRICNISLIVVLAALFLSGCANVSGSLRPVVFPPRNEPVRDQPISGGMDEEEEPSDPRARASFEFTRQGKSFLREGKPDEAISALEKAVGLDPTSGQNYYYLAEAWILKKNFAQAEEFNRLAAMYLENDYWWAQRAREQRHRIENLKR